MKCLKLPGTCIVVVSLAVS